MKFNITANAMFEADNISDACLKLSNHFESLVLEGMGDDVQKSTLIALGGITVKKK